MQYAYGLCPVSESENMYTIDQIMHTVETDPTGLVTAMFIVFGSAFGIYFYSLWLQFREKKAPFYVWQHAFYFAHDVNFVFLFDTMFNQTGFWIFKLMWAGCVAFIFIEILSLYLAVKNERQEVWGKYVHDGKVTEKQAWQMGIFLYIAILAIVTCIRIGTGDVMCFFLMMLTNAITAIMPSFLVQERNSREGHSIILSFFIMINVSLTFAPQGIGMWATLAPVFREPWFFALGAISLLFAIRYLVVQLRLPKKGLLPNGQKAIF